MSRFESVSIVKAANIYHGGHVTSRTVEFADGSIKTLGIMLPGDYEFGTDRAELMEITQGALDYQLSGHDDWASARSGEAFHVPANSSFKLKVREVTDYVCSYLDASTS